jgi:hypothetical protein
MIGRTALAAFVGLSLFTFSCSSPKSTTPTTTADTGTVEQDTGPVEDTAPWLVYPEGPYGLLRGNVFPPLKFKGYKGGLEGKNAGEWVDIEVQDYYDPTGERGIYALLLIVSAEWCGPCREEAKDLPGFYTTLYQPRGARFLSTMIQDSKRNPGDQPTVDRWVNLFKTNFDIVADPDSESIPEGSGIPRNYIINPRDMKINRVNEGVNPDATIIPGLNPMLDYNGAPKLPSTATDAGTSG